VARRAQAVNNGVKRRGADVRPFRRGGLLLLLLLLPAQ
jgi:hypothetical protein